MSDYIDKRPCYGIAAYAHFGGPLFHDAVNAIIDFSLYFGRLADNRPAFWYVPALGEDDEDALLIPTRDGKCPSSYETSRAYPLFRSAGAAPVPSQDDAKDAVIAEELAETAQMLGDLIVSIERKGNFSKETTVNFLVQIKQGVDAAILAAKGEK